MFSGLNILVLGAAAFTTTQAVAVDAPSTAGVSAPVAETVPAEEVRVGTVPPMVELKGDAGGRVEGGGAWSSSELKDKVTVMFYVDPDEKDLNNKASERLKKEAFSLDKYNSVAVINMAATIKPNFLIEPALKEKQATYPNTIYVKDYDGALVKKWKLADDSNDVVVFDRSGKVVFLKKGELSDSDIDSMVEAIRKNL